MEEQPHEPSERIDWEQIKDEIREERQKLPPAPQDSAIRLWYAKIRQQKKGFAGWMCLQCGPHFDTALWQLVQLFNSRKTTPFVGQPDLDRWFRYWTRPYRMWKDLLEADRAPDDPDSLFSMLKYNLLQYNWLQRATPERQRELFCDWSIEDWREGFALAPEWLELFLAEVQDINRHPEHEFSLDADQEFSVQPDKELAVEFLLSVWLPCLLAYGVPPDVLLRGALNGRVERIEQVLQLDTPIASYMPLVEVIQRLKTKVSADQFQIIAHACRKPLNLRSSRKSLKALYAVWMLASCQQVLSFKMPGSFRQKMLNTADIRRLLDAYARDRDPSGKTLQDSDLPDSPEAWNKLIQRTRKAIPFEYLDIFRRPDVRAA